MNIRRLLLDVDKAIGQPSLLDIARALDAVSGIEGINITVTSIDIETVGMEVTIEGENLDYAQVQQAIESTGAVVHSIDQLACGDRLVERAQRVRS